MNWPEIFHMFVVVLKKIFKFCFPILKVKPKDINISYGSFDTIIGLLTTHAPNMTKKSKMRFKMTSSYQCDVKMFASNRKIIMINIK